MSQMTTTSTGAKVPPAFGYFGVYMHRQGIDVSAAEIMRQQHVSGQIKIRYTIHHDTSYPEQSYAKSEVWSASDMSWHLAETEHSYSWADLTKRSKYAFRLTVGAAGALASLRTKTAALLGAPVPASDWLAEGTE
jgi:hypothetical protein